MATSATISYERPDGKIRSIYCHWDGYIEGVGKTLIEHYNGSNLDALMDLGDLSILGNIPQSDAKGWDISAPRDDDYCLSYRDRGETDTDAVEYADFNEFKEKAYLQEYNYLYCYNTWYVLTDSVDDALPLADEIKRVGK